MRTSGLIKLLCISPLFVPVSDSESFCGAKMVKALIDCGIDVKVIFASNFRGPGSSMDSSALWDSLRRASFDTPVPTERDRPRSLRTVLRYQSFYARWLDAVVQSALRLNGEDRFDLVYSRSWPMVAHVAGYWCSKALKLPWVANTNDPWDECFYPGAQGPMQAFISRPLSTLWLQRTFRDADFLMFPSRRLARFHFRLAGSCPRATIIPHVGYAAEYERTRTSYPKDGRIFNIVHAGKIGVTELSGRCTKGLLNGLTAFLAMNPDSRTYIRLTLVGPEDAHTQSHVTQLGLQDNVLFAGQVNYADSLRLISEASACLLVEAKLNEGFFLPSKLVDYIAARKPILALSPSSGVVADLAGRGGIIRVDPSDPVAIAKAIGDLYEDFRRGNLDTRRPPDDLVEEFTPRTVAQKFLSAMAQLGGPVGWKAWRLLDANKFSESTGARRSDVALHNGIPS